MREILSIGECMVELARRQDGAFDLSIGGDTFNTAIYLTRLGAQVSYVTAVGDDPYSARIIEAANAAGLGISNILTVKGRMPGLYLIETDRGERSFWYWRDRAPARELFELPGHEQLAQTLAGARMIYLSGITLSLYSEIGLMRLEAAIVAARTNGAQIAIDGNYRPVGWGHDQTRAQSIYQRFWKHADIALPSFDDECALWGDASPTDTTNRLSGFGVREICLKLADKGAIVVRDEGAPQPVAPAQIVSPIDSTAAGDSFNAGYLWGRINSEEPAKAATLGNRLAGIVIQHPGAIAPLGATSAMEA